MCNQGFLVYLAYLSQLHNMYSIEWEDDYEVVNIWKEVIMTCFKVLSEHLPGGNEEEHQNALYISGQVFPDLSFDTT